MDIKEFENFVVKELPLYTKSERVLEWLESQKYEHSKMDNQKIFASRIVKKRFFIKTKWLMVFHFDSTNLLKRIDVKEDYIAL